jgi:myotubularin-related protein 5/13
MTVAGCIQNLINIITAVLTDKKLLFHSRSYTRLTDACHAMQALIYPLKYRCVIRGYSRALCAYSYVYVPIVPKQVLNILESPTPYIMGVHASLASQASQLLFAGGATDVITVDLDTGAVHIPADSAMLIIPQPYRHRLYTTLTRIVNETVYTADDAFVRLPVNGNQSQSSPAVTAAASRKITPPQAHNALIVRDKMIRAAFLRFFVELLAGYRQYLLVSKCESVTTNITGCPPHHPAVRMPASRCFPGRT